MFQNINTVCFKFIKIARDMYIGFQLYIRNCMDLLTNFSCAVLSYKGGTAGQSITNRGTLQTLATASSTYLLKCAFRDGSWVAFKSSDSFLAISSFGKYPLNIQLRAAILELNTSFL